MAAIAKTAQRGRMRPAHDIDRVVIGYLRCVPCGRHTMFIVILVGPLPSGSTCMYVDMILMHNELPFLVICVGIVS